MTKKLFYLRDLKKRTYGFLLFFVPLVSWWFMVSPVLAYPDFQAFIKKNSGRSVDCAFCHANSNGPEGNGPGQIGSLTPEEFDRLNFARGAFDPGRNVNSPILNAFGNRVIRELGKKKFIEIKNHPADLAKALDPKVDLDGDGIPDVQEFLDGTHPLKNTDGDPGRLFLANFLKNHTQILLLLFATLFTLYGLNNLLRGFARFFEAEDGEGGR
ncbi:MAG TPA: hypothetical protein VMV05_00490 [bacterium]|nr:hypothetical protein [bacterium]